jgi:DNA-binding Xre family transcriptional regulator
MKATARRSRRIGSSFEDFLAGQGILGEVDSIAQKRVLAWQLEEAMRKQGVTKTEMAQRMTTSRAAVDRLLDPENASVTLATMTRAAAALGAGIQIGLTMPRPAKRAGRSRK